EFYDPESSSSEEDDVKREGALKRIPGVYLLKTKKPMYIPITQELPPMTEDMISQQQEVFANLGTSKEASQIRARMQSATLLSDMQSFKAANPDSVLEDFLKWYSPKDVNEDTSMSERMQSNDNLWKKTWEEAKPIPAHKQRKLFNPIREAELVLHYFET